MSETLNQEQALACREIIAYPVGNVSIRLKTDGAARYFVTVGVIDKITVSPIASLGDAQKEYMKSCLRTSETLRRCVLKAVKFADCD